jgi:YD repeat-containing protein
MGYSNFDAFNRPKTRTLTWPNGNTDTVSVTYDREGENTLAGGRTTLVTAVGYNDMGQLKRLALNNGLTTWYGYLGYAASGNQDAYDATWGQFGKLWRICTAPHASNRCTYANRNSTPLEQRLDLRYAYDDVGNLTTILDKMNSDQVQTFGYDHLNRLTSAATNAVGDGQYNQVYTYDMLGNITSMAGYAYWYYDAAHKHAVTDLSAGGMPFAHFSYDANGNMISRWENGATTTQNFNVENELSSVVSGGNTTSFAYDAASIRVKTVRPGGKTTYYPFPGIEEEVNGSTITRRITYAIAGQTVALRVQVVGGSNTLYYLHSDHLGSTSLATTTSGAVVSGSTARYYPFGNWRTEPTANLTDIGFTGHRHNNLGTGTDDIGLIYMNARYYAPYIYLWRLR